MQQSLCHQQPFRPRLVGSREQSKNKPYVHPNSLPEHLGGLVVPSVDNAGTDMFALGSCFFCVGRLSNVYGKLLFGSVGLAVSHDARRRFRAAQSGTRLSEGQTNFVCGMDIMGGNTLAKGWTQTTTGGDWHKRRLAMGMENGRQ